MANLVVFWNICVVFIMPIMTVSARRNIIQDSLGHLQDSLANIHKNVAGQLTGDNFPFIPQVYGQVQFGQGLLGGLNFQNHRPDHINIQGPQNQRYPTDYGAESGPNYNQFKPPPGYAQASASATASASSSNYAGNPDHHHNNQPNENTYSPNNPNSNSHFGHNNHHNHHHHNHRNRPDQRPDFNRYPNQDTNYAESDQNNQFIQNTPSPNIIPNQNLLEHSGNSGHTNADQYLDINVKPVIESIDDIAPPNGPQKPIAFQIPNSNNINTPIPGNRQDSLEKTTVTETKTEKQKEKITSVKEGDEEEQMYSIDVRNGDGGDTPTWA